MLCGQHQLASEINTFTSDKIGKADSAKAGKECTVCVHVCGEGGGGGGGEVGGGEGRGGR